MVAETEAPLMEDENQLSIVSCQLDRQLLDLLQTEFPLVSRPWDSIAEKLSISSAEVMSRVSALKTDGIIRQISAIFDSAALGYTSALIASAVSAEQIDAVGEAIAKHPGVSHCYARDHYFNLWFTLTLEPKHDMKTEIEWLLAGEEGVDRWLVLPAIQVFKIGVFLPMAGTDIPAARVIYPKSASQSVPLTGAARAAVIALQTDIPIVDTPFAELSAKAGLSEDDLLARAVSFRDSGAMRRFAAVLRHNRAGFAANAMVCWRVEQEQIHDIGQRLATHPSVSHCYERPTFPDWPYPLYTMVHSRRDDQLHAVLGELEQLSGFSDHLVLQSVREYKKTRVIYFRGEASS